MKMGFLNRVNIFHPPMTSGDVTMTLTLQTGNGGNLPL